MGAYDEALTQHHSLDPLRLWQSFIRFKDLPTLKLSFTESAVYSSQIEGSSVQVRDLEEVPSGQRDLEAEMCKGPPPSWWTAAENERRRVEDLREGYEFARGHALNEENLLHAHGMLSERIPGLREHEQGAYRRSGSVIRRGGTGDVIYRAAAPARIEEEMARFFEDIRALRKRHLTVRKSFYHAGLIHLVFEKIHPFADGNGRAGRLLEKWFLADRRGTKAWKVPTEEFYRKNLPHYYGGLQIGSTYSEMNHSRAGPFLMLPVAALAYGRSRAAHGLKPWQTNHLQMQADL